MGPKFYISSNKHQIFGKQKHNETKQENLSNAFSLPDEDLR